MDNAGHGASLVRAPDISTLTLEEKATLITGADAWHTAALPRHGVPELTMTDGPHGLRRHVPDAERVLHGESLPATCFPPAVTLGSTWRPDLVRRVGEALGAEARAQGVSVVLGPGVNIKRHPLGGRNFEYFSEDPLLSGELGAALVEGVQSQGIGASVKHFAVNSQETNRHQVSADVDERTLREIYLPAFRRVVRDARPWTVMCSYNRVGGIHASQHHRLLTGVLRDEWGFDGVVVSDWYAVHDRVAALVAGLDLEMPFRTPGSISAVVSAVTSGGVDPAALDRSAARVLDLVRRAQPALAAAPSVDYDAHHRLAIDAAAAGAVLLRNDDRGDSPLLPLAATSEGLVVIGELARTPRIQGGGSSHVHPTRVDAALPAIEAITGGTVRFSPGYALPADATAVPADDPTAAVAGDHDRRESDLRGQAVAMAATARTVVLFLGLPGSWEEEGRDRRHLRLPDDQVALATEVAEVCDRVVVVLTNGSPVDLRGWSDPAGAILAGGLGGQGGGTAAAELLFGIRDPSGRLAETLPHRLEDTPAFLDFPGELGRLRHAEGVFVGYRWYDARQLDVAYPFGHGLSYTAFSYDDLALIAETTTGDGLDEVVLRAAVTVRNVGARAGTEVVQLYVGQTDPILPRPPRELRAFASIHLAPGEERRVEFAVTAEDLAWWHPRDGRWILDARPHRVWVGSSSRDLHLHGDIAFEA